ncbi:hypothetical protein BJ912DRAFT_103292 [Pholiota molesta]|nr:hypothetical protein BJ912DRAFT_103292 [Pholiota molesta]
MAIETTPLLGAPVPGPTSERTVQRIYFLDNLRAVLTILLIFHHAAISVVASQSSKTIISSLYNKADFLPLALFIVTNKAFLYGAFFFVSGYSCHLALLTKSDSAFFISRSVKTGLPALLYLVFGRESLVKILCLIGGKAIFNDLRFDSDAGRLEGPGSYVFTLLLFDYTYLFGRWAGKKWSPASFGRLESRIKDSRAWFYAIVVLSFVLVTSLTLGNCFHLRVIPFIVKRHYPFEFPGYGAPITYIVAYIAGINFPLVDKYLHISRPAAAVGLLVGSESAAYLSLGIAQDHWEQLWKFIRATRDTEGGRYFDNPGFNGYTAFFTLWNPSVFYFLSIALISTFANTPFTNKNWGVWTRHTYIQTYIHMIPVLVTSYALNQTGHTDLQHPVVKTVLSGISGVAGSWAVSLVYVYLGGPSAFQRIYDRLRQGPESGARE